MLVSLSKCEITSNSDACRDILGCKDVHTEVHVMVAVQTIRWVLIQATKLVPLRTKYIVEAVA
jgi:hypothetical protein